MIWRELKRWRDLIRRRLYVSSVTERAIVENFHQLYYRLGKDQHTAWAETYWRGRRVIQCPMDLLTYQEIIHETKPHMIVETGTNEGGLTCFLMDVSTAKIITVDHKRSAYLEPYQDRIRTVLGDSLDVFPQVQELVGTSFLRTMVILDSDHRIDHVREELRRYSCLVTSGCYLIVCDTHFNGHPIASDFGPGPYEAVNRFLIEASEFSVDHTRESHWLTFNPSGFLVRT